MTLYNTILMYYKKISVVRFFQFYVFGERSLEKRINGAPLYKYTYTRLRFKRENFEKNLQVHGIGGFAQ